MSLDPALLVGLMAAGIRLAAPIALAALGETLTQRSGVLNVGIEGIMLVGAFVAVLSAVATGSPWGGLLAAILAGAALGVVHAIFVVKLKADQIVCGIALILLGVGLSGYGYRLTLGAAGRSVAVPGFDELDLFGLARIPVVGPIIFGQHALVYIAVAIALALTWMFSRTRLGIIVTAVGESPSAAHAMGIGVDRVRFLCTMVGGALAGMAGAFLSLAQLSGFVENMVAGRGFIAIACVVFARWNPLVVLAVALVFGIADSAQIRLQSIYPMVPYQFFVIAPYLIAILSLMTASRSAALPSALGKPFFPTR